jgi:hypothetical protein
MNREIPVDWNVPVGPPPAAYLDAWMARRGIVKRRDDDLPADVAAFLRRIVMSEQTAPLDLEALAATDWQPVSEMPADVPVLARYRAWNRPDGEERLHVVWRFAGKVREYPHTDGTAFADGWKALPQIFDIIAETQALRERVRVLEGALRYLVERVAERINRQELF